MCRLSAWVGTPVSPARIMFDGAHSLERQSWDPKELLSGSVNADGWGVVWYSDGAPVRVAEARPIWFEEDLQTLLRSVRSDVALAALRNGTPGLPIGRSALLPMTFESWSFVLNGYVPDFRASHMRALRAPLPDDLYGALRGVSDSETLFLRTVDLLRSGASLREALVETVGRVLERTSSEETQLVMTLTDGDRLAAVRTSNVPATNSLYWTRRSSDEGDGIILASEPFTTPDEWTAVEPHSWIEIDRDGAVRTEAIG